MYIPFSLILAYLVIKSMPLEDVEFCGNATTWIVVTSFKITWFVISFPFKVLAYVCHWLAQPAWGPVAK
jgi:hypothetical protein